MRGRNYRRAFAVVFLSLLSCGAGAQAADPAIEELIAKALQASQELAAGEERVVMAQEKAIQAGALDDPMLMLGIDNGLVRNPLAFDREAATSKVIGLSQMLPFYGKRELRQRGAAFAAAALAERVLEKRIEIRRMVQQAWYRIALVDRNLSVLAESIDAIDDLVRFSETMYGVGKTRQQEVLKAQLERTKMEEMRIDLQGERRMLLAELNGLAYLPIDTPLATLDLPKPDAPPAGAEELVATSLSQRPLFKAQAALLEKSLVGRELAEREIYPDFTVSFEYMQKEPTAMESGDDMYGLSLSFNLPVQHQRRGAMIAEAGAEYRMLLAEFKMLRNQLRKEVGESLARLERNRRLVELFERGLLDQAKALHDTTIASYQVGRAEFMQVLDSRMTILQLERRYNQAVAEYHQEEALLEALVGVALPALAKQ